MGKIQGFIRTIIGGRTLCAPRVCAPNSCAPSLVQISKITWLVYKQGYLDRAKQEHQDLIALIGTIRDKFNLNLVWFNSGPEVIDYLNNGQPRDQVKITGFEYFGHSNRACFMFDYSNNIDSACKSWLHENELTKINRRDFRAQRLRQELGLPHWREHVEEMVSPPPGRT